MELDQSMIEHLVGLLEPLTFLGDGDGFDTILDLLGWDASTLGVSAGDLASPAASLAAALNSAGQDAVDLATIAETLVSLGLACAALAQALSGIPTASGVAANALSTLGADLLAGLLASHAASNFPRALLVGTLLGFVKQVPVPQVTSSDGTVLRPSTTRLELDFTAMGAALADPLGYARATFLLDSTGARRAADAIADLAGPGLAEGLVTAGITAGYGITPAEPGLSLTASEQAAAAHLLLVDFLDSSLAGTGIVRIALGLTDDTSQQGLGLLLAASAEASVSIGLASGALTLTLSGAQQPLVITGQSVQLAAGSSGPVTLGAAVNYASTAQPAVSFGSASSTSMQVAGVQAGLGVSVAGGSVDVTGSVSLTGVALQIRGGDGDGFLSTVLPQDPIELRADLGLDLSLRNGVRVHGSGGLAWSAAINKSLGPVELDEIAAALTFSGGAASFQLTATLGLALGPLEATIDAVGITAALQQAPTTGSAPASGNAGPYALTVGFKAPDGAGLVLDAGPVTGGGYVQCDAAQGQYAGVLELALESLALTAIGLIQTKATDGTPLPGGFSLLVIISVEFLPPIELGFGFSLDGVGGLVGLSRTTNVDALRAGVRSGSLADIMFPVDPVGHAPQIVQALEGFFPAAPGRFLIGPIVQIEWGSPLTIVTAELGVLIELPTPIRITILGVLEITLPPDIDDDDGGDGDGDLAIVDLNLDALGVLDLGQGLFSLDASLYDSRVTEFTISGDMAMRLGWGADREFLISVGGFHPAFSPPPGFPTLNRLAISLSSGNNPTFSLQAYFAVTSNTLQFGAKAQLSVTAGSASVSGMMSFDTLIHLKPFGLEVDFAAALTIKVDGQQLMAVTVTGQITGPSPWLITGKASVQFLFISVNVNINCQLGSATPPAPSPPTRVIDLLTAEIGNLANWSALPPSGEMVVTLQPAPSSGTELRAHPLGSLTFSQHTVPLGLELQQFGGTDVAGPAKLALTSVTYGSYVSSTSTTSSTASTFTLASVQDAFAPAQFLLMSDSEALSQPSFVDYQSGVAFSPTNPALDQLAVGDVAPVGYAIEVIDDDGTQPTDDTWTLDATAAARLTPTAPAAYAPTRTTGAKRYQSSGIQIAVKASEAAGLGVR